MNKELIEKINTFREERDWNQFHNPKDLSISISLEAAELLEIFQWSGKDLNVPNKTEKMEEELADIIIYSIMMSETLGFDIEKIVSQKLDKNSKKYPINKAFGKKEKYNEL